MTYSDGSPFIFNKSITSFESHWCIANADNAIFPTISDKSTAIKTHV